MPWPNVKADSSLKQGALTGFFSKRPFWVNLLVAIGLSIVIVFLYFLTLDFWTNHGKYLRVPDLKGKTFSEANQLLEKAGFDVMVQDSVYVDTIPPNVVVKQFPDPDATVKVNRTVYLTVNRAVAPLIDMPNLVGMSFRNAELELRSKGLKLGDTSYVPDIAKNAVKDQQVDGATIRPGAKVAMGTAISLVLGAGIGNEDVAVPDLFGMSYGEAVALLDANGINLGVVLPDQGLTDTTAGYVYWQTPARWTDDRKINRIRPGQMMDIRLSPTRPARSDSSALPPPPASTPKEN
jgi:eukaryotic-like serine/threonine-protein kinase